MNDLNTKNMEVCGIFTNTFPIINKFNMSRIQKLNSKILPNQIMRDYIDETLNELKLEKKGYGVIHIRTGDKNLGDKEGLSSNFIQKIRNMLLRNINNNKKYLIISDSNTLKRFLKDIPNFYIIIKEIEHLGGVGLKTSNGDGIKNTLLDFYLIQHSNIVLSFSIYEHGSGFSKWSSILNGIPYHCFKIDP